MSYENWKNKAQGFQTVDVRHIQGSFFEGLKKRAEALEVGEGLHIIQTFEPVSYTHLTLPTRYSV